MTRDEAIDIIKCLAWHKRPNEEDVEQAIKTLEQEPTTKNNLGVDCISREQAINAVNIWSNSETILNLQQLPSVTPQEPRKGHWINKDHSFETCSAECSSCHKRSNGYMRDNGFSLECKYYDFCPKCGSDNREVEE